MKKIVLALLFPLMLSGVAAQAETITLAPGESRIITLPEAYKSSTNSNKAVAITSGRGSNKVKVSAKRKGASEVALYSADGDVIEQLSVVVGGGKNGKRTAFAENETDTSADALAMANTDNGEALNAMTPAAGKLKKNRHANAKSTQYNAPAARGGNMPEARNALRQVFPNEDISVERVQRSVVLSGKVSDAETAARIVQLVQQMGVSDGNVINMMQVKSGQQVMLRVRIGEVQRGAMDQLGLSAQGVVGTVTGLFYSSKMYDVSTRLDALSQNGLMRVLAEPNLTAISGEKAKFLAGGEFPIPVPQKGGDVFTVEYKPFGVGIEFTPTVLSQNRIRLAVEPEVSEISGSSVKFGGAKIPGLSVRRAKTTVELAPGESFMIAGLISDNAKNVIDEMPVLGDIPVLGALFRSSAFKRNETELVIAITPYLVDPVAGQDIKLPTDDFRPASVMEQYFMGALGSLSNKPRTWGFEGTESGAGTPQLEGKHGFMTE